MDQHLKERLVGAAVLVVLAVILIPELLSGRKPAPADLVAPAGQGTRTITIDLAPVKPAPTSPPAAAPEPSAAVAVPPGGLAGVEETVPEGGREPAAEGSAAAEDPIVSGTGGLVPPPLAAEAPPTPEPKPAAAPPVAAQPPASRPVPDPAKAAPPAASAVKPAPERVDVESSGVIPIQVGAFGTAESADRLVRKLAQQGFRATVSPVTRDGKTLHRVRVLAGPDRAAAEAAVGRLKALGLPATIVAGG